MHRARAERARVLRQRRPGLGALHRHAGRRIEGIGDEAKQALECGRQFRRRCLAVTVRIEERHDHVQRLGVRNRPSCGIERGPAADDAARRLELAGIDCRGQAVVVQIVERFVHALEVHEIAERQQALIAIRIGLMQVKGLREESAAEISAEARTEAALYGTEDQVAAKLQALQQAGVTYVLCNILGHHRPTLRRLIGLCHDLPIQGNVA